MKILKFSTILVLIAFASIQVNAQKTTFTLGIIMPEVSSILNQNQVQKVETRITQIINNSNEAMVGFSNDFVVYPVISIDETKIVEGGMQNITVTTIDFSLFVKQISSNMVYGNFSNKLKGSGNNESEAVTNALNQIKVIDDKYSQFIKNAVAKIYKYYNDNCKTIIEIANNSAAEQDFEKAIGTLQSIPVTARNCYDEAQKKSIDIYKKYQLILCSKNINNAKAEIAVNNFSSALEDLQMIDPTSTCGNEANKLIVEISHKVGNRQQQEISLEEHRINAMKEIAKAYYSNTVRLIGYNLILR